MSPGSHERLKAIFTAALQQPGQAREKYLAGACGDDDKLLSEVKELLELHVATGDFLNTSLPELLGVQIKTRSVLASRALLSQRYRIERLITESGFATVYLAEDQTLAGKPVVIKLLNKIYSDQFLQTAFQAELHSLSRVQHPNVVGISDVGKLDDGTPFLVLNYVPGLTLREALSSGPVSIPRAKTIVQGIARALAAAHKVGVWHLDLKPENIILSEPGTPDERVTVIDFGIARLKDLPGGGFDVGSPRYMAPEQRTAPSHKSDLYSLARVSFEILTGHLPLDDDSLTGQLPAALDRKALRAITQTLDNNPEQRLSSASDFSAAFSLEPARPATLWLTAAAFTVVTAVLLYRTLTPSQAGKFSTPVPLVTTPGFEYQPSFSPDGKWLFYAGGSEAHFDIYRKEVSGGEPVRIVDNPNNDIRPHCSPDGKTLAFIRAYPDEAAIVLKPLDPLGPEMEIARQKEFDSLTWTPDGKHLLVSESFSTTRHLALLSVDSHEKREMISALVGTSGDMRPAFSPDGSKLAFVRRWDQGSSDIFVADVDSALTIHGALRQITHDRDRIESLQWTPDGKELLFVAGPLLHGSLWRIRAAGGEPAPMLIGVGRIESIAIAPRSWKIAYAMLLSDTNIWRLQVGSTSNRQSAPQLVIAGTYEDREAHLSPDGTKLAFVSSRSGEEQAWLAESNGANPRKLTTFANPDSVDVTWLRDSSAILVSVRSKPLGRRIFRAAVNSSHEITDVLQDALAASVSRDGTWMYFCRRSENREWQLWRSELANLSHVEQLTTDGGYYGLESPDGKTLYFTKQSEAAGIWRLPLPNGTPHRIVDALYRRDLFVPTTTGLFYVGLDHEPTRPLLYSKPTGAILASPVHTFDRDVFWGLDLSPDERSLLFSQYDVSNSDIMLVENFR